MRRNAEMFRWEEVSTALHEARLDAVMDHLAVDGVATVLDLGCGSGALLERLLDVPRVRRVVGVDHSPAALLAAERRLTARDGSGDERVWLRQGSIMDVDEDLAGFDAAALVEAIEHVEPALLSGLERSIFGRLRPRRVVMTTPNVEYNVVYGLARGEHRHPHHHFEWDRARFERWSTGVAGRNGYGVAFEGIGPAHACFGCPTQMAVFRASS